MKLLHKFAFFISLLVSNNQVFAASKIDFGEGKFISVGIGAITSYQSIEDTAASKGGRLNEFKLNSARLIVNGQLNNYFKGMLRTERLSSTSEVEVIDANVQLELAPEFTIWAGRFLSPSDRSNMSGPYNSMGGGFWAGVAARYAAHGGYVGRDDGLAIVGTALNQRLHYSIGAFDGNNIFRFANVGDQSNSSHLMYAGRVQYDFWDTEKGYYGTANYFGKKDVFSIGMAGRFKNDGVENAKASKGDFKSYSLDVLLEKTKVGPGAISIEAAFYSYDTEGIILGEQGTAYLGGIGYIFKEKQGWGQLMPFVRYQKFKADGVTSPSGLNTTSDSNRTKVEYGINYVIEPYNAMITAIYSDTKITGFKNTDSINVVMQFQF